MQFALVLVCAGANVGAGVDETPGGMFLLEPSSLVDVSFPLALSTSGAVDGGAGVVAVARSTPEMKPSFTLRSGAPLIPAGRGAILRGRIDDVARLGGGTGFAFRAGGVDVEKPRTALPVRGDRCRRSVPDPFDEGGRT